MSGWSDYGFPDPFFYPIRIPAEGLWKALEERALPYADEWDIDTIKETTYCPFFESTGGWGDNFFTQFDARLAEIAPHYYNHTREQQDGFYWKGDLMWDFDSLIHAAAEEEDEDPIFYSRFTPIWNIKWLTQRYRAVNLLKFFDAPSSQFFYSLYPTQGSPSVSALAKSALTSGEYREEDDYYTLALSIWTNWSRDPDYHVESYGVRALSDYQSTQRNKFPFFTGSEDCIAVIKGWSSHDGFYYGNFREDRRVIISRGKTLSKIWQIDKTNPVYPASATFDIGSYYSPGGTGCNQERIVFADYSSFFEFKPLDV